MTTLCDNFADLSSRLPSLPEIDAELGARSLLDYARIAWPAIEPGTEYSHNWHIEAICEHFEAVSRGEIRRLIVNIPPRHMKSLLDGVFWPTWHWGPFGKPETRWLYASYAQTLSIRDSLKCRRLIQSPWYQERWGSNFELTGDQNAKMRYDNDRMGYRLATSVGGALTGEGGDIIVIDDPHNASEGESDAVRESTIEWWDHAMSTRLNNPKTGAYVVVMQRIHDQDLVGHILAKNHGWDHLCLPARYESDHPHPIKSTLGFTDPRTKDGELLWPDRMGEKEVSELEEILGPYAGAGQLQQRPTPAGGAMFKREWLRYFKFVQVGGETYYDCNDGRPRVAQKDCWRFATVDSALTEEEAADYTVRQVWDVEKAISSDDKLVPGRMFLVDQWRERKLPVDMEQTLRNELPVWNPLFVGVEDWTGSKHLLDMWKRDGLPVRAIPADKDKSVRAIPAQTMMFNGRIFLPIDAAWRSLFEDELLKFPIVAHDDQVDAFAHACAFAQHRDMWSAPEKKPYAPDTYGRILGHDKLLTDTPSQEPRRVFALDAERAEGRFNSW